LVGIGLCEPESSGMCRAGYVDAQTLEGIRGRGLVGDIIVEFFDLYGRVHETELSPRVVGMRLADLRDVPSVIAVAGSIAKAPAILGALRTGLIHVLVTDNATARRVLDLADAYPAPGVRPDDWGELLAGG
jgi:DNA-binding transcriptional regulator LsrR (DeoR family)